MPIDSPPFGRVITVCVGELTINKTTVKEGDYVKMGQEFGYFPFGTSALFMSSPPNLIFSCVGSSTIIALFEKGKVTRDKG